MDFGILAGLTDRIHYNLFEFLFFVQGKNKMTVGH